jgi:hypothetical protein
MILHSFVFLSDPSCLLLELLRPIWTVLKGEVVIICRVRHRSRSGYLLCLNLVLRQQRTCLRAVHSRAFSSSHFRKVATITPHRQRGPSCDNVLDLSPYSHSPGITASKQIEAPKTMTHRKVKNHLEAHTASSFGNTSVAQINNARAQIDSVSRRGSVCIRIEMVLLVPLSLQNSVDSS